MKNKQQTNGIQNKNKAVKQALILGIPAALIATVVFWILYIITAYKNLIVALDQPPTDILFGVVVIFLVIAPILTLLVALIASLLIGGLMGNSYWRLHNSSIAKSKTQIMSIGGIVGGIVGAICGLFGVIVTDQGSILVLYGFVAGFIAGVWHAWKMVKWLI